MTLEISWARYMPQSTGCSISFRSRYLNPMVRGKWEQEGRKDLKDVVDESLPKIVATQELRIPPASAWDPFDYIAKAYGGL